MQQLPHRILGLALAIYFLSEYFFPDWGGAWQVVVPVALGIHAAILLIRDRRKADAPVTLDIQR